MTRKTKKQREAELLQRIEDIYAGACGGVLQDEMEPDLQDVERIIPAVKERFNLPESLCLFRHYNLAEFASPKKLCAWILRNKPHIDYCRKKDLEEGDE